MAKPRIGLIHYTYPPIIGGVERIVFDHAQLFAKYGFPLTVFTGEGTNENKKITLKIIPEFRSLGIIDAPLREKVLNEAQYPSDFYSFSELIYKKIEKEFKDIDIFFIHNILTFTFNPCLNQALIKYVHAHPEKKYIVWIHDIVLDSMRKKRTFLNRQLEELFYQPLPGVTYVGISQFLKKTLVHEIGFPDSSIRIIHNGIDFSPLLNLHPITQQIIHKYNIFKADPLIFLPTKVMKHKNIDICLKVLHEIKKIKKNPFLIITAKNFPHNKDLSYLEEIESLIKNLDLQKQVLFLHKEVGTEHREIEYKIVDDFYRLCDIVFFLSSYENFGLPLLEAGITKTPILLSNLEVFKEIDAEHVQYVDIENEDPKEIAHKVLGIIDNNDVIPFFRKVKREYNFDSIMEEKIIPLIEEIWKK